MGKCVLRWHPHRFSSLRSQFHMGFGSWLADHLHTSWFVVLVHVCQFHRPHFGSIQHKDRQAPHVTWFHHSMAWPCQQSGFGTGGIKPGIAAASRVITFSKHMGIPVHGGGYAHTKFVAVPPTSPGFTQSQHMGCHVGVYPQRHPVMNRHRRSYLNPHRQSYPQIHTGRYGYERKK